MAEKQNVPAWLERALDPSTPNTEANETVKTENSYFEDIGAEIIYPTIRMGDDGKLYRPDNPMEEAIKNNDFIVVEGPPTKETAEKAMQISKQISNQIQQARTPVDATSKNIAAQEKRMTSDIVSFDKGGLMSEEIGRSIPKIPLDIHPQRYKDMELKLQDVVPKGTYDLYMKSDEDIGEEYADLREEDPEAFDAVLRVNTDVNIQAMDRAQFSVEDAVAGSPIPEIDTYLMENSVYLTSIPPGYERKQRIDSDANAWVIPDSPIVERTQRGQLPGVTEDVKDQDRYRLHETVHASGVMGDYDSLTTRLLAKTIGDESSAEAATTGLDLYRAISRDDPIATRHAIKYLSKQKVNLYLNRDDLVDNMMRAIDVLEENSDGGIQLTPERKVEIRKDIKKEFKNLPRILDNMGLERAGKKEVPTMDQGGLMAADETYVEDGSPDVEGDLPFTGEDIVRTVAELAPVTGEILSAKEAVKDYEEGNYGMAALGAVGALPGVGIMGRGAKKAVKTAINVRKDVKAGVDYAEEIISGNKKYETRDTPSLDSYVGQRIGIAKTGDGEAKAIGSVEIGDPIVVDEKQFREMQKLHLVPEGSAFDIKPGGKKYLYPVSNPERFDTPKSVGRGIVSRKIIDDAPVGKLNVEDAEFKKLQSAWKERTGKGENKEVSRRFEEMTEAAQKVQSGELSVDDFRKLADKTKPVTVWDFVPEPATYEDMFFALDSRKRTKPFLGYDIELEDGVRTTSRLDIPAYTENDVWVVTLKGGKDAADGQTIYSPAVRMKDVDLSQSVPLQMKSLKIAAGGGKGPHAVMSGAYVKESVEDTHKLAKKALNSKEWTQVGYDPTRRGYFYDRKTMEPVLSGEDLVQVGPLVLVKNATKGKAEDFQFSTGGLMSGEYNRAD